MFYVIQNENVMTSTNREALSKYYSDVKHIEGTQADYSDGKFIIEGDELILNPNYEEEKAKKERARLDNLSLTAADVERAIYKVKGMDFDDLLQYVSKLAPAGLDIKALKIELKANNFYRGNPYINQIGHILDFTDKQLDEFFETGDAGKLRA